MAGLCEGGNEPPGSFLKSQIKSHTAYSESHRSGGINDVTLQRTKEQNCWKDRWLSWRLYKLLSVLR
ncbi:hypothetical protein ANN_21925 [Periplaneta americana]|uniref:Uncharacterized protein n=1 Tax=Periplaneta americana TaxID=6978 RepID=A0ABQ8S771_PERAM|nr:hypothetical protein ANN_21925 [Periplaneta americana]